MKVHKPEIGDMVEASIRDHPFPYAGELIEADQEGISVNVYYEDTRGCEPTFFSNDSIESLDVLKEPNNNVSHSSQLNLDFS